MRGSRVLAVVLLFGLLLPGVGFLNTALAQDGQTFDTTASFYMLGDPVDFIAEPGLVEGKTYNVTVYRGESKWGIEFPAAGPIDSWDSSGKEPGTYSADLYNVTDNVLVDVDTVHFGLWGTDKAEYIYPDIVTISGGGVGAGRPLTINITNGTWVPTGYPKDISADGNGEFLEEWDFYDASTGTYTITVNGTGSVDVEEEEFRLETTVELTVTAAGRAESIRQQIDDKMVEIGDAVSDGYITDIDGALIAKLTVISDKIQQAIDWLGTSRDKVARNMLNAARNKLKAFINQVRAQRGKHIIDTEVADGLIDQAENLVELIDGLIGSIDEGLSAQLSLSQTGGKGKGNKGNGNGKGNNGKGNGKGKGKGKPQ